MAIFLARNATLGDFVQAICDKIDLKEPGYDPRELNDRKLLVRASGGAGTKPTGHVWHTSQYRLRTPYRDPAVGRIPIRRIRLRVVSAHYWREHSFVPRRIQARREGQLNQ